jgi:hypothetical protein
MIKKKEAKYNYSFPITMGKKGNRVLWTNFDKRCLQKLGYVLEHHKGYEYLNDKGELVYYRISRQELIKLGFLAAAGLTDDYGKVRSWNV